MQKNENAENPAKGKKFQQQLGVALEKYYGVEFRMEHRIAIENPPKEHKFDLVSANARYVAECKNFSWTKVGNVPSAKMGFCNQAVFYLSFLPRNVRKLLVLRKAEHPRRKETLATYYKRIYKHLLGGVLVMEFSPNSNRLDEI